MNSSVDIIQSIAAENSCDSKLDEYLKEMTLGKCKFDIVDLIGGISEYIFIKRERSLNVEIQQWDLIEMWMKNNWKNDYEFVENAIWLVFHGKLLSLLPCVESSLKIADEKTKNEIISMIECWKEKYGFYPF